MSGIWGVRFGIIHVVLQFPFYENPNFYVFWLKCNSKEMFFSHGIPSGEEVYLIPSPRSELQKLFAMTNTPPPTILPAGKTNADTKRKLKTSRK